ncbi:MAG: hypothetical protein AB7W28_00640 [Armatimonadota bacterium]
MTGQSLTDEEYEAIYFVGGMIDGLQLQLLRAGEGQSAGN